MHFLNVLIEILTSPFSFLMRANVSPVNANKWCKPLIILFVSVVIVAILVLYIYRDYIFK